MTTEERLTALEKEVARLKTAVQPEQMAEKLTAGLKSILLNPLKKKTDILGKQNKPMPYSKEWYQKLASEIPGIAHVGVARRKPGSVDLFFSLEQDADADTIYKKISRSMEAEKGLYFECRAILLKAVKTGVIGELG